MSATDELVRLVEPPADGGRQLYRIVRNERVLFETHHRLMAAAFLAGLMKGVAEAGLAPFAHDELQALSEAARLMHHLLDKAG